MVREWEKYDSHPQIGPLIEEYRYVQGEMETLKNGLRTQDNIDDIMRMSYDQAGLKREIDGLVGVEEASLLAQRRDTLWLAVTVIATVVGASNLLIALGVF